MNTKTMKKNWHMRLWLGGIVCAFGMNGLVQAEPKSGYEYLSKESKEMQDDDFLNPGMQAVDAGAEAFKKAGANGKSCGSCHGEDGSKLDPKRIAMYPVYDEKLKKPVTLQQRIHMESEEQLGNKPMKYDGKDVLNLEVFVRNLARGEKVNVQTSGPMQPFYDKGKELYAGARSGQLDMACTNCHDVYAGLKIRANTLSQGQSNGYPAYRLKNGKINGLHSRTNGCYRQFRAQPREVGGEDLTVLELYVNARSNGLPIETPGIRY
ncbi:MAG TPA: sulfur oxidation c-type cytochrome SoxA [Chromatiales bacterium]|nr:sulfur oxidation c-type cytochrome SoxA [Chromatiales bacterium]